MISTSDANDEPRACQPLRRRLLVLGCSRRKREAAGDVPAIDRYDGPSFRVLRRYQASRPDDADLTVLILSAEHGLISGATPIAAYDREMTPARARELRPSVLARLAAHAQGDAPVDILLCCSRTYRLALAGWSAVCSAGSSVCEAPSRPGEQLAYLYDWLYGRPPALTIIRATDAAGHRPLTVRGRTVTLSAADVLEHGRQALARGETSRARPAAWSVDLDGTRVSPKWLIGLCFGLQHGAFGTGDALRVLASLGIPARRPGG